MIFLLIISRLYLIRCSNKCKASVTQLMINTKKSWKIRDKIDYPIGDRTRISLTKGELCLFIFFHFSCSPYNRNREIIINTHYIFIVNNSSSTPQIFVDNVYIYSVKPRQFLNFFLHILLCYVCNSPIIRRSGRC